MRKFLLSLIVMLMAGMDYAMAATFPTFSTPDKPVLYYIRNTRVDKFAALTNTDELMQEIAGTEKSEACMFWFEATGDLVGGKYQPVKVHNITTAKTMGRFNRWNAKGSTWYLCENSVNPDYLGIGAMPGEEGNTNVWWNDWSGSQVGNWCMNGDQGSIWDIVPVPEEEIPAGLTVITWNLKSGDDILLTVKSVAIQGVKYNAPFDDVSYVGSSAATGGMKDQTISVQYAENFPFTASKDIANAVWYKTIMRDNKYLHYDNPNVSCTQANKDKNDMGSYFAFVGDAANGFRIYNAALTSGKALGGKVGDALTAVPEDAAPAYMLEHNGDVYVFKNIESGIGYLNDNNSTLAYWINNASATDGGSKLSFEEVDAEIAGKIKGAGTITYKFFKDGQEVGTPQSMRAMGGDPFPAVPTIIPGYYGETPKGVVNGDATFDIELKPAIPASKDYASATWFRLMNRPNGNGDRYLCYQEGAEKYELTEKAQNNDNYLWALIGSPEEGYMIMNKAAGDGMYLSVEPGNGNFPTMTTTPQVWEFQLQSNGNNDIFGLGAGGFWINDYANNHFLSLWQSGPTADVGSTLKIVEVNIVDGMYANEEGFLEIGSADDLKEFAEIVNGKNPYANAILVADIDKGTENYRIGRDGQDYQGIFEGNGHTITYDMTFNEQGGALFRNVGVHAVIQNLKVQGTINTSEKFAGSIAGWNSGRIIGCYADVTINSSVQGDATHGGLVGIGYRGTVIENCLVNVAINGEKTQNCGGVVGWANDAINIVNTLVLNHESNFDHNSGSNNIARNGGNIRVFDLGTYNQDIYNNRPAGANYNNYVTQQWGDNNATTVVAYGDLADGKICYQLNNDQKNIAWVQTIGTDAFPVPAAFGSGQVYASGATDCKGTSAEALTYSNTPSNAITTAHQFDKYGICSTCGCFNFGCFELDAQDNAVLLKNADDIFLAEGWNRVGDGFKLNMKMANDIKCISEPGQYIFNTSNWVDGNFNGDGHVLTIEMSDLGNYASFIPQHTGVFENVIMHGSISTNGQYAGSISGEGRQAAIRNVYSDINITSTRVGDNTSGGLLGMIRTGKNIDNCIYAGTFTLPGQEGGSHCARVGGVAGWTHATTYVTNCAILGKFVGAGDQTFDDDTENSQNIARNPGNIVAKNVYVLNPITGNAVSDHDKYTKIENPESVASGELAFLLNESKSGGENFYQLIGTDPQPMPFAKDGAKVYTVADSYKCDGTPQGNITYQNEETTPDIPAHEFEEGVCKNCGDLPNDKDGYKMITTTKSLARFSALVNEGKTDMKVRMYEDVDMLGVDYATAGNTGKIFVGEFDGQGHVISNLTVNGGDYTGLIGVIGDGAIIQNFTLDKTCSINGNAFVGAIGGTNGSGNVYIKNIGNEGTVTGAAQNASGILGVDMGGSMTLHISNCYVTGAIKGARESATICSWSNDASVVENCWSIATLEGVYGNNTFTRGGTSVINGFELEGIGTQNGEDHGKDRTMLISQDDVVSGKLCFDFNQRAGDNLLGQNLSAGDAYPSFTSNMTVDLDEKTGVYYNPMEIADVEFINVEDGTGDLVSYVTFNKPISGLTSTGVALIMEREDFELNGISGGKHLFGAVAKNNGFSMRADNEIVVNFNCFSGHTDQPIFAGDLPRANVGDVKPEAEYVIIIYGGTITVDGDAYKDNLVYYIEGADLISLLRQALAAAAIVDDPTAIDGITTAKDAEVYSITGVRVNKAQKGVYIIDGKKTAVK